LELAIDDLDQAIVLNPEDAAAYNSRALAYSTCGDLKSALEDYDQALLLSPLDATAYYNRAVILRMQGELERAMSDYHRALELAGDPNLADTVRLHLREVEARRQLRQPLAAPVQTAALV
jgi:tetratricopeptide (TPR) repeat protein